MGVPSALIYDKLLESLNHHLFTGSESSPHAQAGASSKSVNHQHISERYKRDSKRLSYL